MFFEIPALTWSATAQFPLAGGSHMPGLWASSFLSCLFLEDVLGLSLLAWRGPLLEWMSSRSYGG